jgi:hypothetical protein
MDVVLQNEPERSVDGVNGDQIGSNQSQTFIRPIVLHPYFSWIMQSSALGVQPCSARVWDRQWHWSDLRRCRRCGIPAGAFGERAPCGADGSAGTAAQAPARATGRQPRRPGAVTEM